MCAQPQPGAALSAEEQEALDARLWAAAAGGDAAAVVRLAGEGASADAKDEGGCPAVVVAANQGHTEVVEALLRLGCDPNAPDRDGGTALMMAAYEGRGGVVGTLLQHGGAELDTANKYGKTALMLAAAMGRTAVAAQLVEAGADATPRATGGTDEGKTALEMAEAEGHAKVAALLRWVTMRLRWSSWPGRGRAPTPRMRAWRWYERA